MNNVKLDVLKISNNKKIIVVRDDLLDGGTKERAAFPYIFFYKMQGIEEFVYASPFSGYAQIALSCSANKAKVKSTIFAECDNNGELSNFSKKAALHSKVILCNSLTEAENEAVKYTKSSQKKVKIPLGFDDYFYRMFLEKTLTEQWNLICDMLKYVPNQIWLPLGSGTLVKTFRNILPDCVRINSVDVGVLSKEDERIFAISKLKNVNYIRTKQPFSQEAEFLPPIPSNLYYDAKLWHFIFNNAQHNDLWWNVAS